MRGKTLEGEVSHGRSRSEGGEKHKNGEAVNAVFISAEFQGQERMDNAVRSGEDAVNSLNMRMASHAPSLKSEAFISYNLEDAAAVDEDGGTVEERMDHGICIATTHGNMKVDLARLIGQMRRKRLAKHIDLLLQQ